MGRTLLKSIGQLAGRFAKSKSKSKSRAASIGRGPRSLRCEPLEERRLLSAAATLSLSGSTLTFDYGLASTPSIAGSDHALTFSTGTGGGPITFLDIPGFPTNPSLASPVAVDISAFGAATIDIVSPGTGIGTETFHVGALNVGETLQIDNSVHQAEFDGAVTAASIVANTPMDLNGGTVTTTNGQTYGNAVTLSADTTLTDSAASIVFDSIWFESTVDAATAGGEGLTVRADGTTEFDGYVGDTAALHYLDVGGYSALGNGLTDLNAPAGTQTVPDVTTQDPPGTQPGQTYRNCARAEQQPMAGRHGQRQHQFLRHR